MHLNVTSCSRGFASQASPHIPHLWWKKSQDEAEEESHLPAPNCLAELVRESAAESLVVLVVNLTESFCRDFWYFLIYEVYMKRHWRVKDRPGSEEIHRGALPPDLEAPPTRRALRWSSWWVRWWSKWSSWWMVESVMILIFDVTMYKRRKNQND